MDSLTNLETAVVFPVITVAFLLLFFLYYRRVSLPLAGTTEWVTRLMNKPRFSFIMLRFPMEKRDILPIIVITVVFTALAFLGLGDFEAPQSFFQFTNAKKQITLELNEPTELSSIMYYTGLWTGYYTLELSHDGVNWQEQYARDDNEYAMHQKHSHLFKWRYADINDDNLPTQYIRLTASKTPLQLGELALYDSAGRLIPVRRISNPDAPQLFDEQELVPAKPTYMNSMYFDEIYHGRTALEHLHTIINDPQAPAELQSIYPYETTHPPLGKLIIALGVYLFGMVPFGWRFMGALFGAAMLPILYIFLKNLFGKTPVAVCGTLLFGFEFMRYTQTRIATIDTYAVFFIMLSYFFMYRYLTVAPDSRFRKRVLPLALAGLFFGIGCASKWTVIYAGLGLAALWVLGLIMLRKYYRENEMYGFGSHVVKTVLFSALFFAVIPVIIYCLSYIPYGLARDMTLSGGMLWDSRFYDIIWESQKSMLSYHGKLVSEHSYSSRWYQWIVDGRPILYYREYEGNMKSAFAAFGNPVVWWGGLLAVIAMFFRVIKHRDSKALFILISYFSQLMPWFFISRVVFVYHYFPAVLFLVLALAHIFNTIFDRAREHELAYGRYKLAVYGFTAVAGALFIMFYPALSGVYAPQWYFKHFLRWIPGAWPF